MFMQVLIERARRIAHRGGYIQLILRGGSVFLIRIYGWVDIGGSEEASSVSADLCKNKLASTPISKYVKLNREIEADHCVKLKEF